MSTTNPDRVIRKLMEAEGYLALGLPERALAVLESRTEWHTVQFEASFLMGEALRSLGRYREALVPLERAARLRPGDPGVAVSLGWCYKRTHRLAQAIDALEQAIQQSGEVALLHYNLACYLSLLGNPDGALRALARAFGLEPELRGLSASESDLDPIRQRPEFQRLVAGAGAGD